MLEWIQSNQTLLLALGVVSAVTFLGSLIAIPLLVVSMRADYFVAGRPPSESWRRRHPIVRTAGLILKNVLGALLVLAGVAMLALPGQGVLTILIGISLLNFPGKKRLELAVVRLPAVLRTINWMRARKNRSPLVLPADPGARSGPGH